MIRRQAALSRRARRLQQNSTAFTAILATSAAYIAHSGRRLSYVSARATARASAFETLSVRIGAPLAEVERELILATMDRCEGNKRHAAKVLGVSLKTLYNRLNEYRTFARDPHLNAAHLAAVN